MTRKYLLLLTATILIISILAASCTRVSEVRESTTTPSVTATANPPTTNTTIPTPNKSFYELAASYGTQNDGISLVVMIDGKIVFEDYANGGSINHYHELASGTKSFSGVMAVAAEQDGILRLDEKVCDTITEWKSDPLKSQITIRQLLTLTSGLQPDLASGAVPTYAEAIGVPVINDPGAVFSYGSVPYQVFGEVLRRKLLSTSETPLDYLKRRVFDPIGLEVSDWTLGSDGNPHLPSGARLTAREWAKFGQLVIQDGKWEGNNIIESILLQKCFQGTTANPAYGLTWWLNS